MFHPNVGGVDIGCAVLIEVRRADAIRQSLHRQRPILDGGEDVRRSLDVVAEQVAFGEFQLRPEDLVQVRDAELVAITEA